jgi:hypothetical protein
MSEIVKTTHEWETYFDQVNTVMAERDKAKEQFEHYENKVIRLQKQHGKSDNDAKKLQRNYSKYIWAKGNYINKATAAYNFLNSLLSNRFEIINPVLLKLFNIERKLYQTFLESFGAHNDLKDRLENMTRSFSKREQVIYDPVKYIRSNFDGSKQMYRKKSLSSSDLVNDLRFGGGRMREGNLYSQPMSMFNSPKYVTEKNTQQPPSQIREEDEFNRIANIYSTPTYK